MRGTTIAVTFQFPDLEITGNCKVKIANLQATETKPRFSLIHNNNDCISANASVQYKRTCTNCNKQLTSEEIAKAYRFDKDGNPVVFGKEEIAELQRRTASLELNQIVSSEEIPEENKNGSMGLWIDTKKCDSFEKAHYATLIGLLNNTPYSAMGKLNLRNNEYLIRLYVKDLKAFVQTLAFYEDIKIADFEAEASKVIEQMQIPQSAETLKQGLEMIAKHLIVSEYENTVKTTTEQAIRDRLEGKTEAIARPAEQPKETVSQDKAKEIIKRLQANKAKNKAKIKATA